MGPWLKYLPYTCEDWSSDPWNSCKFLGMMCVHAHLGPLMILASESKDGIPY